MASYATMHNRLSSFTASAPMDRPKESSISTEKVHGDYGISRFVGIPSSPVAAAVRIIINLRYFSLYYTLVVWVILFVSLIPKRKVSLIFLIVMSVETSFYLLLLRIIPYSVILHKIIDRRLVLVVLLIVTVVELIVTDAGKHLLVSSAIGIPIILVHAVLRVTDDLFVNEEAAVAGGLVSLVHNEVYDIESQT